MKIKIYSKPSKKDKIVSIIVLVGFLLFAGFSVYNLIKGFDIYLLIASIIFVGLFIFSLIRFLKNRNKEVSSIINCEKYEVIKDEVPVQDLPKQ